MCGIFALLNSQDHLTLDTINELFLKSKDRGPEYSELKKFDQNLSFGFHRLAINGLDAQSNQPMQIDNIVLIANAEIYNYKQLFEEMKVKAQTNSDCEIIIHLYRTYGIDQTVKMLDGVFAFILYDRDKNLIFVARDNIGIRPLYFAQEILSNRIVYSFASELKSLAQTPNNLIEYFPVGSYAIFSLDQDKNQTIWIKKSIEKYFTLNLVINDSNMYFTKEKAIQGIQEYLSMAVKKRFDSDREIAACLSGGLDSSLIAALLNIECKKRNKKLLTFSIGLVNSEDLLYAKIMADYLGSTHTEIILQPNDMLEAIDEVIEKIESYDTTTIRASIGNYLLGKYINANSDAKVIFNGDGSDELTGGYLYMHKATDPIEFDCECRRLLRDISKYDVLRSDKSISSNGLEPRTPFLDKNFVQFYLSIPINLRAHPFESIVQSKPQCEKYLLREAFSPNNYLIDGKALLPDKILWRKKEAFSDGVCSEKVLLRDMIQNYIKEKNLVLNYNQTHLKPKTIEEAYYRTKFDLTFPFASNLLEYFWMPKYIESSDPSARTLNIYSNPELNLKS